MAASTDYTRFISAIADTHAGILGYTVTITDPTTKSGQNYSALLSRPDDTLTKTYLLRQISTSIVPITSHLTVTHLTATDDTPQWHIFVPESVIAPEACYAHSPIDDFCRKLNSVIPRSRLAFPGIAASATTTTDPVPAYTGRRRSTRIAAKYTPPLESPAPAGATTGGVSAHSVDVSPDVSVPEPTTTTKPNNRCSFTTRKGIRCKRKCVPDSTVCHQHEYDLAVREHKAKKATVPKPTTNDILHEILSNLDKLTDIPSQSAEEVINRLLHIETLIVNLKACPTATTLSSVACDIHADYIEWFWGEGKTLLSKIETDIARLKEMVVAATTV